MDYLMYALIQVSSCDFNEMNQAYSKEQVAMSEVSNCFLYF